MVLNALRGKASRILSPIVERLACVNPNYLTLISIFLAVAGGYFYFMGGVMLLLSSAAIGLSGLLDALDGEVARRSGNASRKGDFLDHLGDRVSDVAILLGISLSPYATGWICLLALSAVLLTSYVGTQAQAVGLGRVYGGLFGRADRMLVLTFLPVFQYIITSVAGFTVTDIVMLGIFVLSAITFSQRLIHVWQRLEEEDEPEK